MKHFGSGLMVLALASCIHAPRVPAAAGGELIVVELQPGFRLFNSVRAKNQKENDEKIKTIIEEKDSIIEEKDNLLEEKNNLLEEKNSIIEAEKRENQRLRDYIKEMEKQKGK